MPPFQQAVYTFRDVVCLVGGVPLSGFTEDNDCIIIKRRKDVGTLSVGSDGNGVFSQSADRSYEITIKLQGTSVANSILQDLLSTSDLIKTVVFPLHIQNISGLDRCTTSTAVISKQPDLSFGAESTPREWVILAGSADVYVGGNLV